MRTIECASLNVSVSCGTYLEFNWLGDIGQVTLDGRVRSAAALKRFFEIPLTVAAGCVEPLELVIDIASGHLIYASIIAFSLLLSLCSLRFSSLTAT